MKAEINSENKKRFIALYCPYGEHYTYSDKGHQLRVKLQDISLNLKPLSSISDEDAIELGYHLCEDQLNGNYGMSSSGCFLDDWESTQELLYSDSDYLRSRGYAIPWMGLSVDEMVEAGWIKLTE